MNDTDAREYVRKELDRFGGGVDVMVDGIAELHKRYPASYDQRIEANVATFCDGSGDFSYEDLSLIASIALDRLAMIRLQLDARAEWQ